MSKKKYVRIELKLPKMKRTSYLLIHKKDFEKFEIYRNKRFESHSAVLTVEKRLIYLDKDKTKSLQSELWTISKSRKD